MWFYCLIIDDITKNWVPRYFLGIIDFYIWNFVRACMILVWVNSSIPIEVYPSFALFLVDPPCIGIIFLLVAPNNLPKFLKYVSRCCFFFYMYNCFFNFTVTFLKIRLDFLILSIELRTHFLSFSVPVPLAYVNKEAYFILAVSDIIMSV